MKTHDTGVHNGCPSGKFAFFTRRAAKKFQQQRTAGDHTRPYLCACGFWHNGHFPDAVKQGRLGAAEIYGKRSA